MRRTAVLLVALLVATAAWAMTESQLEAEAADLLADLEALDVRVDACPDGDCTDAQDIVDDFDALEADRSTAHSARSALDPCTCTQVDATLSSIDDLAGDINGRIITWEQSN